jgi:hypothetical protein
MWTWLILLIVVGALMAFGLFFWGLRVALFLGFNSVVGFFALYAFKAFIWNQPGNELVINFWSVLLTALFGIFGLIIVLLLHFVHVAF